MIRHRELAARLGVSVATVRRAIDAMVAAGHIRRSYMPRSCGGRLAVYRVQLDVVYRRASTFRRAGRAIGEHFVSKRKQRQEGRRGGIRSVGGEASPQINNDNYNRSRVHSSVKSVDKKALDALLHTARLLGIDDRQRGWLRGAALKYGVMEAWQALQIAVESGRYRVADLVRVTWGILKRQRRGVIA